MRKYLQVALLLGAAWGAWVPQAHATVITFDDLAAPTSLTTQYAGLGVTFTGFEDSREVAPEVRSQQFMSVPASGPNYLTNFFNFPSTAGADRLDEIRIVFLAPTTDVEMDINTAGTNDIRFDIYDFGGAFLTSVVRTGSGIDNVHISLPGTNIGRISAFQPEDQWWWSLDNLQFSSVPLPGTLPLLLAGLAGLGLTRKRAADKSC